MPAMPDGVEDGIVAGLYRYRAAAERRVSTARRSSPAGTAMLAALDAQAAARRRVRRRRRRVERDELQAAARGRAERASAGTGCTRPSRPARPYVTEQLADAEGPDRRGHRLHEGGARPDRAVRAAARSRRSAPTATASPTPAPRSAATSRSTRRTSWSRCCTGWRRAVRSRTKSSHEAITRYDLDADKPDPRLS